MHRDDPWSSLQRYNHLPLSNFERHGDTLKFSINTGSPLDLALTRQVQLSPARGQRPAMPFDLITGKFIPEKSNIWRDCVDGYYDWVKEHIMEGAPLNESDHCGDPPLLLAAGNGHLTCVKLLLDEGADIEQRNVMLETPIIRCAHNGHFETVQFLVENGADVNSIDLGDNTALHWAAMRGHVEIVKYLLQQHADREMHNKQGKLPIDLCQPNWSNSYRFTREVLAS